MPITIKKNQQSIERYEDINKYNTQYRENNIDRLREYDRARSKVKTVCETCGKEVGKLYLSRHQENAKCQLVAIRKNKPTY